jgi:choline dehydrogenase-like flavoprotein
MFIDARTLPEGATLEADICIIGGGAAGITLARDLAGGGRKTILFESGGFAFDQKTQDLYEGVMVGQPLHPLTVERLRFFGGSTNHWAGGCRPFDEQDLAAHAYIPDSGWPIGLRDLEGYYRRAQKICQLGPYVYETSAWAGEDAVPLPFAANGSLRSGIFQYSPPTRFGEVYRQDLASAPGITVYLHANVVNIDANESASRVTGLQLACLDGRRFRARAKGYVLATGGIENARLLLSANSVQKSGLGNGNDLVGRYFMDHPYVSNAATVVMAKPHPAFAFYQVRDVRGTPVQGYVCATIETRRREKFPTFAIGFEPGKLVDRGGAKDALSTLYGDVAAGHWPDHLDYHLAQILHSAEWELQDKYYEWLHIKPAIYSTNYICECPPDRDSRVTLGDGVDALGMRRVKVDWRLPADFRPNLRRALELLGRELGRAEVGRLRINPEAVGPEGLKLIENGYHHMGTTRMHADPRHGVVDANCRVHGIANLFVAGSSVFPTYSFDNPTMTIVALTLRLSDHLKSNYLAALASRGRDR